MPLRLWEARFNDVLDSSVTNGAAKLVEQKVALERKQRSRDT